jgi:asparagine synthase (glutamine-hydrolysing)
MLSLTQRYNDTTMCGIWGYISHNDINIPVTKLQEASETVQPRGPERTIVNATDKHYMCFHRLAINGLSSEHDQPYVYTQGQHKYILMCNGEIYNQRELEHEYCLQHSACDTEVIYPVWKALDYDFVELNKTLNGEYALAILHLVNDTPVRLYLSVDPCSVRPLFFSIDKHTHSIAFSSLLVGLSTLNVQATRLPGGTCLSYYFPFGSHQQVSYIDWHPKLDKALRDDTYALKRKIVKTLTACIEKRLQSDRPIGCFLSGGLDSSLVAAILSKLLRKRGQRLHTFSIGAVDSEDCRHAQIVATHIDSIHTHVPFDSHVAINYLQSVVKAIESYDITTVRASIGQYLVSKYIAENTDIKVVFSGDGADEEQMGYLYFFRSPSPEEANEESRKLLQEIHLYDGLRVDRCVSVHGLEARVPYLDWDFVSLYLSIPAYLKCPKKRADGTVYVEKALIRDAFMLSNPHILPQKVLYRTKETFSDSLSTEKSSWYALLKATVEREVHTCAAQSLIASMRHSWKHLPPTTDEGTYYRYLHTLFFGQKSATVIPHIWMPNWSDAKDPSARQLEVYNEVQK